MMDRVKDMRRRLLALGLAAAAAAGLVACTDDRAVAEEVDAGALSESWEPERSREVEGVPTDSVRAVLRARLDAGDRPAALSADSWRRVEALYSSYGDVPLWYGERGLNDRAGTLVEALASAHEHGLRRDAYPLAELHQALRAADEGRATADELARADLLLTGAYVAYAEDMFQGQLNPREISQGWYIDNRIVDVDSAVARTLRREPFRSALAAMRPSSEQYDALRRELSRYRRIVADGGWTTVPEGESLRPGDTTSVQRLQALASRLRAEGYLDRNARVTGTADGRAVYDRTLAGALATFQARHNIVVDSILGPETLSSLNRSASYRLQQIAGNLERLRWLPNDLGDTYVFVNVPAFELRAVRDGRESLQMKVIVGAEYNDRATPAFADSMSTVVFAPYWNVPQNIAEEELWPKERADPGYLERNHYEVVNDGGYTYIRQTPGPWNALGQVKFLFPNDFAIYLHDTPADNLFAEDVRAFSHGCIRVERPADLAQWVLGWDAARVRAAMNGERREVSLPRKIPVYIVYYTTYLRDGALHFGNDLYERDDALVAAVGDAMPDARSAQHARALQELVD